MSPLRWLALMGLCLMLIAWLYREHHHDRVLHAWWLVAEVSLGVVMYWCWRRYREDD